MLRSLQIKNFRCFEELTINPLERVNLIGGMNNVGKTSLLEAIFIDINPSNPGSLFSINRNRGIRFEDLEELKSFFFNQDLSKEIVIESLDDSDSPRSLKICLSEPEDELEEVVISDQDQDESLTTATKNHDRFTIEYQDSKSQRKYPITIGESRILNRRLLRTRSFMYRKEQSPVGIYITASSRSPEEDAKRFSDLERVGRQEEVLETLQLIEPRLKRLTLLVIDRETIIHGDIGLSELVPIPLMGEGLGRLLSILLAIANAKGGTVLIDEIENGLHYSVLFDVWRAIAHAARQADVQIFATTHSQECIRAAHRAFERSEQYDFRYHRLERVDKAIKAVTYDRETLGFSDEMSLEMR